MGIGEAHQVHHPLHAAILAGAAVEGVEHDVRRSFGQLERDIAAHVDAGNRVAARFERLGDALAAHQRHRAFTGPAAHQDGDAELGKRHSQILPGTGRWREATEGACLSAGAALEVRGDPSVRSSTCHLPVPGRI